jgi:glycosyltransferase involved in cell wall biosynthesis
MYYRKPVVVSDVKPLKRIVTASECGLAFKAGDHEDLARTLLRLIMNPSVKMKMGDLGRKAVENLYNWDIEKKKLISTYDTIV